MRIHRDDTPAKAPQRRAAGRPQKTPPNYYSRRVQLRLLLMIMSFGAVLWMMNEARKPKNWEWFTSLDRQVPAPEPVPQAELDTRFRERPKSDDTPPGVIYLGSQKTPEPVEVGPPPAGGDARSLSYYDAWKRSLAALDRDERQALDRLLLTARGRGTLQSENAELRKEAIGNIGMQWKAFLDDAFQAVVEQRDSLTDEEKESWLVLLREMEVDWRDSIQPALMAVSSGEKLSAEQQASLRAAQQTIDQIDLAAITDNTVYRPSDHHAWFRMLEKLENQSQAELESLDVPSVGFVELFEQPDNYRGKLVRISGQLRMAKLVRPQRNMLDIDEYYMFWIKPDGSNSPLAIYSLELPDDFPALTPEGVTLSSRVTFTGYFFKRWVYAAGDGPRITPLLLARAPTWTAEPVTTGPELPSWPIALAGVCGTAVIGIVCAVIAFRAARVKSSNQSPYNTSVQLAPERLAALEQEPAPPTVGERLDNFMAESNDKQGGAS